MCNIKLNIYYVHISNVLNIQKIFYFNFFEQTCNIEINLCIQCQRRAETEYPQPRGEKKSPITKYLVGGGCLIAIIALIWFPLVLFALGNTVGQANLPYDVTLNVRINAYQPIYTMSAQNNSIFK